MPHPCAGHACDHCYVCDVVGVCCSSVSAQERAQLEAGHHQPYDGLAVVVAREAGESPSLRELVRADAGQQRLGPLPDASRPALPVALKAGALLNQSRKEAVHVVAPHTAR